MEENNKYTQMQEKFYSIGTSNHVEHNSNPDYWGILLEPIDPFVGGKALDFGCGKGRNIINLQNKFSFERVDGVDISENNINHCKSTIKNSKLYKNNGVDLSEIDSNTYDFVMSTIVLQHIPVHEIRYKLISEIYRVMNAGGTFRFQLGYGGDLLNPMGNDRRGYFENYYDANGTNGVLDFRLVNEDDIIGDLTKIGFKGVKTYIKDSFSDDGHPNWIYITCNK